MNEENTASLSRSTRNIYLAVGFMGLLMAVTLWFAMNMTLRAVEKYSPLSNAAMEIKFEAALAHLWFEEIISGDRNEDINEVWNHLDQSEWYAHAMLKGGSNAKGKYIPLEDPKLRQNILEVIEKIRAFRFIAKERLANLKESAVGSDIDQRFDNMFNSFLKQADDVEIALQIATAKDINSFRILRNMLVTTCLLLALFVGLILHRYERRRTRDEMSLRASEETYRAFIESNPYGFEVIDVDGKIQYSNPAYQKMVGYSEAELLAKSTLDLLDTDEARDKLRAYLPVLLKDQPEPTPYLQRNRTKDGRIIEQEIAWNYRRDNKGQIIGFASVITDITETKRLQQLESRAERLETAGTIAGQVAHDFNNLLAPLIAYPDFIREELPDDHPALAYLDDIENSAKKIADINQQLLTLGRRGHYNQEVLNLNEIVHQTVRELTPFADNVTCETDLDPDLMNILGGGSQIHRVVTNLLCNALDSLQETGQVSIRTENYYVENELGTYGRVPRGEFVKLTISDTGRGIPEDIAQKILDPFFTTKTSNKKRGSGLGLSVVDSVVKDHGGYLDLESKPGKGTSFYIYFPITRESLESPIHDEICGGSETILVVDDDDKQREVSSKLLSKLGYKIHSVESGEKAVEFLRHNSMDIVILDMIMSDGIDGTETYRRIIEISPRQKAIILSGFSETDRVLEVQKLGVGAFVRKPVTRNAIALAVREELDRVIKVSA